MVARKILLSLFLVLAPCGVSWLATSCDDSRLELEIIGQSLEMIQEGYYQNVQLAVNFEVQSHSARVPTGSGDALATSPAPPVYRNKVSKLEVRADVAYDSNHPAGSDLIDLVLLSHHQGEYARDFPSLNYPIDGGERRAICLYLISPPDSAVQPNITVTTFLDNGLVLESSVGPVLIQN
jgi:hypothetical protein